LIKIIVFKIFERKSTPVLPRVKMEYGDLQWLNVKENTCRTIREISVSQLKIRRNILHGIKVGNKFSRK